ncbi:sensor histidine kinase [Chitinophaga barathri]|uniref:GHKL domain-containing protein n=1 Tax=Chitinophaga barathri TaxID=1647451 RepID=A0A3N4MI91_9BACT|nr:histidine kinase [Chitinophaga barathri]RPD39369.1 GHKL domain-containing protein [Chitinophaga barathri]
MKSFFRPGYINIALHVLIWSAMILMPYVVSTRESGYSIGSIPGLFFSLSGFIHMAIFYTNAYFLIPKLFNKRFWWLYLVSALLLTGLTIPLKWQILAHWFPNTLKDFTLYRFIFAPSFVTMIISFLYRVLSDRIRHEKEQKERRAEQMATELKFLRSQVSPHFLFNVLTNLVSLARKKSDQMEPALIRLSGLMRYMLYDTQQQKVELQKEIEYLNSYVELQKLRFGNDVDIEYEVQVQDDHYNIEPMLLIAFVENAFKHGTGTGENPWISIRLKVDQGVMVFEVQNRFEQHTSKDDSSGIGLHNVKARLNLLYKGRHQLDINEDNKVFKVTLTLQLT